MTEIDRLSDDYVEAVQECEKSDNYMRIEPWGEDLDHLRLTVFGRPRTAYEGGTFVFEIFLFGYPWEVPVVYCHTKIWHPNISNAMPLRVGSGVYSNICLSLIDPRKRGEATGWKCAGSSILVLITSICRLLSIPYGWELSHDAGLNHEAANQYWTDKSLFIKTAKQWSQKYAGQ